MPMSNAVLKNSLSRKEATQSPQAQELFHLLIENVIDYAIFTLDIESNITSWNIGAERILGYTEDEVVGQPVSIIFTPEDRLAGADKEELRQAVQTGRAEDEREHLRKDGSRFWALGIMTGLKDENGKLRGWVKILRDFTERKRYEERLERAVAETNHRVKNSLQVACALIEMHTLGHEHEGAVPLATVKGVTSHLRAMVSIQELLTHEVKIDAGATHLSAKVMLEKLLSLVQRSVGEKQITYQTDEFRLPVKLLNSLAILVNELIANAVKHGHGTIQLSLMVDPGGQEARLEVNDDGPGFPEGFNPRHAANTGLELVEGVIQYDLLGQVSYGSNPSGGGRVVVVFPIPSE
jgi:PAS domain S-box-containing protein